MTDGSPWTIGRVIAELPRLGWLRQETPLHELSDQRDELCQAYSEDFWATLPISKAEVFAAISPYLREPESKLGRDALSVCLRHDIEAARALTQPPIDG